MADIYATSNNSGVEISKDYTVVKSSKLPQVISRTITELTEEDLQGLTEIGAYAFYGCSNLAKVSLPNSVIYIQQRAFFDCDSLTSISLLGIRAIYNSAFSSCNNLTSVTFGEELDWLYDGAFSGCPLTSIVLPATMREMGGEAFSYCSSLTSITCYATTPPTIGSTTFRNVPSYCVIKVPAESVNAYKSATNWSVRANYIQAI